MPTRIQLKSEIESMIPSFKYIDIDGYRGKGYISYAQLEAIRNELVILRK